MEPNTQQTRRDQCRLRDNKQFRTSAGEAEGIIRAEPTCVQERELKPREVKQPAQNHTANQGPSGTRVPCSQAMISAVPVAAKPSLL